MIVYVKLLLFAATAEVPILKKERGSKFCVDDVTYWMFVYGSSKHTDVDELTYWIVPKL